MEYQGEWRLVNVTFSERGLYGKAWEEVSQLTRVDSRKFKKL